jgi:hypothetical protein
MENGVRGRRFFVHPAREVPPACRVARRENGGTGVGIIYTEAHAGNFPACAGCLGGKEGKAREIFRAYAASLSPAHCQLISLRKALHSSGLSRIARGLWFVLICEYIKFGMAHANTVPRNCARSIHLITK